MNAITIHPKNKDQEKIITMFLDALKVKYASVSDDTEYLLSSEANAEHLKKSIRQADEGKISSIDLDEIWK